jgi:hypothetical protein
LFSDEWCLFSVLQAVLGSSKCLQKGFPYNFFKPWLGEGLFTCTGKQNNVAKRECLGKISDQVEKSSFPALPLSPFSILSVILNTKSGRSEDEVLTS